MPKTALNHPCLTGIRQAGFYRDPPAGGDGSIKIFVPEARICYIYSKPQVPGELP
jgi:hypothetical protein